MEYGKEYVMAKEIEYTVVKTEDITSAMKASSGAVDHERKGTKQNDIVWNQTTCIIMERIDYEDVSRDTSKEGIAKIGKHLKGIMANHILAETTIPLRGKNRKNEDFDVMEDGIPKWGSWSETRRIWDYLGSIAKVIAFEKEETLYPESMKVGGRCAVLKECKVKEDPIKAVDRLSGQLQDNLDVMKDSKDVLHAHNAVNNLMVNNLEPVVEANTLIHKLDTLMDQMSTAELDTTRTALTILTKYFKA